MNIIFIIRKISDDLFGFYFFILFLKIIYCLDVIVDLDNVIFVFLFCNFLVFLFLGNKFICIKRF